MELRTQHQLDAMVEALKACAPPVKVEQDRLNGRGRMTVLSGVGTGQEETILVGGFDYGGPQGKETTAERRARLRRENPELR